MFSEHLKNLKSLNLPKGEFAVVSSGSLAIHGIREAKDIDLIVTDSLWNELSKKYQVKEKNNYLIIDLGNDIEVLGPRSIYTRGHIVPPQEVFENADIIEGVKFMNLKHLRKIKTEHGREKDLKDVVLIDNYLQKNND
jgi:hypothetical protein